MCMPRRRRSFFGHRRPTRTIHIWGRTVLDQAQQTLRLTDVELAVESEAAFGLLGAAARAVVPNLQRALLQKMTVDLKTVREQPASRRSREALAELRRRTMASRCKVDINAIRLADIAYDAKDAACDRGSARHDPRRLPQAAGAVSSLFPLSRSCGERVWGEGPLSRIRCERRTPRRVPLTRIASSMRCDLSPHAGRGEKCRHYFEPASAPGATISDIRKLFIKPDILVVGRNQESPARRQAQIFQDSPDSDCANEMHEEGQKISCLGKVFARPDVPPGRIALGGDASGR